MGGSCCISKEYETIKTDIKFIETELYDDEEKEEIIIKNINLKKIALKKTYEENQKKFQDFCIDINNQINDIDNYKKMIKNLNYEFNEYNNKFIISLGDSNNSETNNINNEDNELLNELNNISNRIDHNYENIKNMRKNEITNIENIYNNIKQNFNEINENRNLEKDDRTLTETLEINNTIIYNKLNECQKILDNIENNKNLYNYINHEILTDINQIEIKIKEYKSKKDFFLKTINNEEIKKKETKILKESNNLDLDNSMLLNYQIKKNIFCSEILFQEENDDNNQLKGLFRKNWNEIVYIYNDYDIHEINFDLTAINIPIKAYYDSYNLSFNQDKIIEIIEFKIDEKCENYNINNNSIKFNIHLENMQKNKIILKYKELPSKDKLTEGEIKERQFFRNELYGLSKKLKGQKAKFTLSVKCDFEIINFEDEFFIKTNEKEYTWGGIVPQEGKKTSVKLSKLEAKYSFNIYKKIETINKQPITKIKFVIPLYFEGGNNIETKIHYSSIQTDQIQLNKEKKQCEINFINIQQNFAEFCIEGELINRCKGEWNCDLTDEEIEKEIPEDIKKNKNIFKQKAENIIKEYDLEHKDDLIQITDFAKIGKWIKKNIEYDNNYIGKNDITATDTLENKKGVCDHFTKLYNAFIYSLGYQCIYVSGYVIDKRDIFEKNDYHCWTLIKVNGKWLPFDVTWGIFSGKLPVSHIFEGYFSKGINSKGTEQIKFVENRIYGKFLE